MDNLNITVSIKHETISAKLFLENEMQTVHILAKIPANESFSVFFPINFSYQNCCQLFKKSSETGTYWTNAYSIHMFLSETQISHKFWLLLYLFKTRTNAFYWYKSMKVVNIYLPTSIKMIGISHDIGFFFNRRRPLYVRKNKTLHAHTSSLKD